MKIEDEQKIYYHAVRSRRGVSVIGLPGWHDRELEIWFLGVSELESFVICEIWKSDSLLKCIKLLWGGIWTAGHYMHGGNYRGQWSALPMRAGALVGRLHRLRCDLRRFVRTVAPGGLVVSQTVSHARFVTWTRIGLQIVAMVVRWG
jgi:hypothetical protein